MASKSTQVISTKKSKPTIARSNNEPSGHVTRSVARNQPTTFVALPSNPREPVITLANLADKHASTASYDGSPNGDEDNMYGLPTDYSSQLIPMQVMVTDASTIEEQITNLMGAVEKLTKTVEEKDMQIDELYSKLESQDEKKKHKVCENSRNDDKDDDGSLGSMSFQQLQDIITNSIRAQYGGPSRDSLTYYKPYTKRINGLRMPLGYQPPKFQQFERKGNPKQHVAHFIETCNNTG
ncbi:hypothetical protein ACLB2K_047958 [Fragaria x ananassa]